MDLVSPADLRHRANLHAQKIICSEMFRSAYVRVIRVGFAQTNILGNCGDFAHNLQSSVT